VALVDKFLTLPDQLAREEKIEQFTKRLLLYEDIGCEELGCEEEELDEHIDQLNACAVDAGTPDVEIPALDPVALCMFRETATELSIALKAREYGEDHPILGSDQRGARRRGVQRAIADELRHSALLHVAFLQGQRWKKGEAQAAVAEAMDIKPSTLRSWEREGLLEKDRRPPLGEELEFAKSAGKLATDRSKADQHERYTHVMLAMLDREALAETGRRYREITREQRRQQRARKESEAPSVRSKKRVRPQKSAM
jgi:hypothetical protein